MTEEVAIEGVDKDMALVTKQEKTLIEKEGLLEDTRLKWCGIMQRVGEKNL